MKKLNDHIKKLSCLLALTAVVVLTTCRKPFFPSVNDDNGAYLVVDGVINSSSSDSTIIRLSRTSTLDNYIKFNPEAKATVTVEDEQNGSYTLKEIVAGKYAHPGLALNTGRKYHLRIKTTDGQIYLSDYEAVKITPPIDTVAYHINGDGVSIDIDTHDPSNNTRYYRWEYEETWLFHSAFDSFYESTDTSLVPRTHSVYTCFAKHNSSNIDVDQNVKLSKDQIQHHFITSIPSNDEKLGIRYSILVKQYGLTQAAYEFWDNMKRNNLSLGGVFDALPAAPTGNVHCITNPAVPVIGFVSVCAVSTKRIFIDKSQLPQSWAPQKLDLCALTSFKIHITLTNVWEIEGNNLLSKLGSYFPIKLMFDNSGKVIGSTAALRECVDCSLKGNLAPPSYWK